MTKSAFTPLGADFSSPDYRRRLFMADYAADRGGARRFGKTAEQALSRWLSGSLKHKGKTPIGARPAPAALAPVAVARQPRVYQYKAGAKYVVYGLPGWPIMMAHKDTDVRPGTGPGWVMVGRAG